MARAVDDEAGDEAVFDPRYRDDSELRDDSEDTDEVSNRPEAVGSIVDELEKNDVGE